MKVKDLLQLLQDLPPDANIWIACTPDVTGWVNDILPFIGKTKTGDLILGPREETVTQEEQEIDWPQRPI
jgi:hypothetical protein